MVRGPQLCLRPRPVARARIPEGRAPFYGPKSGICWGLGPQLHGPVTIRLEATPPARFTAPYVWGWGPSYTSPPHGR
eukprot:gene20757-biopygen2603